MENTVLIEEYRGFDIYLDKLTEYFICVSREYDTHINKKKLSLVKKEIDNYIKDNLIFTPIFIETGVTGWGGGRRTIKLASIREDERFIFENKEIEGQKLEECEHPYAFVYSKCGYEKCNKCGKVLCEG